MKNTLTARLQPAYAEELANFHAVTMKFITPEAGTRQLRFEVMKNTLTARLCRRIRQLQCC